MAQKTKIVKVGNLAIGGKNPIRIKGMLKTPTAKLDLLLSEAKALEHEGAEALRVAVETKKDTKLAKFLKKHISIPIAADIHFDYRLALSSIKEGFDQIRLNPLNIAGKRDVREIAKLARDYKVPIRVGINSGGLKKKLSLNAIIKEMVGKCSDYLEILEKERFFETIVSLKSASLESTLGANRLFRRNFSYPLHLGITATGSYLEGIVKSSAGLGIILAEGIGDILRVSLTTDSLTEIKVAKYLVQSLNLRQFGPEIISCPTCSRCEVDLAKLVDKLRRKIDREGYKKALKVAVMGCVVNGPGEAAQADLGVAFGKKTGVFFRNGEIIKKTTGDKVVKDLIRELEGYEH